jgi:hypothetical protein
MLEEFERIVGEQACSVFLKVLSDIGPTARTHRISVVIAGMLRHALHRVCDEPPEGSLAEALWAVDEEPHLAYQKSPQSKRLLELIDRLCEEAGMVNEREDYRGHSYSIGENVLAEYDRWYSMPWEAY